MKNIKIEVPNSFFCGEMRNEYFVDENMKKVWAVELDLLNELLTVCDENNLTCYADAGTLLGTIRHKGFIPWDDDIDVCMFRKDYDKLLSLQDSFKPPYKLQSYYTEHNYPRGHAQLRNTQTTCILRSESNKNICFNQGIFIDIFVLDYVPNSSRDIKRLRKRVRTFKHIINYKTNFIQPTSIREHLHSLLVKMLPGNYRYYAKILDKTLRRTNTGKETHVAPLSFKFDTEKRIRVAELYEEVIWLPFEFMRIPVPKGYDIYLTNRYGDYMKPSRVPNTHGESLIDAEHPENYYENDEQEI